MPVSSVVSSSASAMLPQIRPSLGGILKKVGAAFCGFLLLSSPGAQAVSVGPYALRGRTQGSPPVGTTTLSAGLADFHSVGQVAANDGRNYCSIDDVVPDAVHCQEAVAKVEGTVQKLARGQWDALSATPLEARERGAPSRLPHIGVREVHVLANPAQVANAKEVYAFLQEKMLASPEAFFAKSETELLDLLKDVQKMFCKNNLDTEGQDGAPGKLRTQGVLVTANRAGEDPVGYLVNTLKEQGGPNAERQTLLGIFRKMKMLGSYDAAFKKLTPEEMRVLRKVAFIPTAQEKVKEEMLAFVKELKVEGAKVLSGEVDALSVAAWVHQEIGRIHPFEDHNGHTARALMQAIMRLGGYPEIIFPDDDEYTAAVVEDQKNPGAFVSYLNRMLQWNKAHKAELIGYGVDAPADLVVEGRQVDLAPASPYRVGTDF
ncbi:MAG: Fic family protein [Simkaniaceae bacterium]|nr:Fic family protein [Candidatus Sacchlamyda saccharinae]